MSLEAEVARLNPQPGETFVLRIPCNHWPNRDAFANWWRTHHPDTTLIVLFGDQALDRLSDADLAAAGLQRVQAGAPAVVEARS